jgi:hypothetical protein
MLIYRIQKNEVGPFENKYAIKYRFPYELEYYDQYLADGSERNQQPDADEGSDLQKFVFSRNFKLDDYIFGFEDKEHMYKMFSPVKIGYLYATEYNIWVYDVPREKVIIGNRQLCFRAEDAISIKKTNSRNIRRL